METTLICALTRKRAIEIARERAGALRSVEQNRMRYSGALDGGDWEWAYIGNLASIFGRPAGIRVILDNSAQQLDEWPAIVQYIARNDFRCEWVGNWGPREWGFVENGLSRALTKELERIGYCAVCKKKTIQVYLYEKLGLLYFRHAGGKECRVALDMKKLETAAQTLLREARSASVEVVNRETVREWMGPGVDPDPDNDPIAWTQARRARALEQMARLEAQYKYWQNRAVEGLPRAPQEQNLAEASKPILLPVIQSNTIRKVKFD